MYFITLEQLLNLKFHLRHLSFSTGEMEGSYSSEGADKSHVRSEERKEPKFVLNISEERSQVLTVTSKKVTF